MTKNSQFNNLTLRVVTATILAALVIFGVFYVPQISFGIITAFIMLFAATEWPRVIGTSGAFNTLKFLCCLIIFMAIGLLGIQLTGHSGVTSLILFFLSLLLWLWLFRWILCFSAKRQLLFQSHLIHALIGLFILTFCWLGLNVIRDFYFGKILILYFFMLIWGSDIAAYFAGKYWGTSKLIPAVSPKKTWMGVYAAIVFSIVLGGIAAVFFPFNLWQRLSFIPLSVVVCIISIWGDLLVSAFKRAFDLKDTGSLLPGHGGILDRIDSLAAGAPIFALGLLLMGLK